MVVPARSVLGTYRLMVQLVREEGSRSERGLDGSRSLVGTVSEGRQGSVLEVLVVLTGEGLVTLPGPRDTAYAVAGPFGRLPPVPPVVGHSLGLGREQESGQGR